MSLLALLVILRVNLGNIAPFIALLTSFIMQTGGNLVEVYTFLLLTYCTILSTIVLDKE